MHDENELIEKELLSNETEDSTEKAEEAEDVVVDEAELLKLAQDQGLVDAAALDDVAEAEDAGDEKPSLALTTEEEDSIMASIETILFMSDRPVSLPKLRTTINSEIKLPVYRTLMARLREEFAHDNRGVEIAEVSLGFQLRTKPHMASVLRKMVKTQPLKLTGATMEVLAITAYKQPITKEEIDQIRGVDSGYVIRNLMEKHLVKIAGRSELPGKPMVYGTTHEFLELFSLKDLSSLPALHEVESMVAASEVGAEERQTEAFAEFGKMVASSDKILFDDSQIDTELEALRNEIASVSTSTEYIEYQKNKEKFEHRIAQLAAKGLTLDADENEVPLGSVPTPVFQEYRPWAQIAEDGAAQQAADAAESVEAVESLQADAEQQIQELTETTAVALAEQTAAEIIAEMTAIPVLDDAPTAPSTELEQAAADAQWERHAEMIAQATAEAEIIVENAEAAISVDLVQAEQTENAVDSDTEIELEDDQITQQKKHEPESSV